MLKYTDYIIGYREFPDEMSLLINISGCPNKCPGCHSAYLQQDIGDELTTESLDKLINDNKGITCIGFMGGDQAPLEVVKLGPYIEKLGPLDNPSTNQRLYMNISSDNNELNPLFVDITEKAFWAPKPWDVDYFDYIEEKEKQIDLDQ